MCSLDCCMIDARGQTAKSFFEHLSFSRFCTSKQLHQISASVAWPSAQLQTPMRAHCQTPNQCFYSYYVTLLCVFMGSKFLCCISWGSDVLVCWRSQISDQGLWKYLSKCQPHYTVCTCCSHACLSHRLGADSPTSPFSPEEWSVFDASASCRQHFTSANGEQASLSEQERHFLTNGLYLKSGKLWVLMVLDGRRIACGIGRDSTSSVWFAVDIATQRVQAFDQLTFEGSQ